MLISRRRFLGSLAAAGACPALPALADTGEQFPVFQSEGRDLPYKYQRHEVDFVSAEAVGTIVVDPGQRLLFHVLGQGRAMRYGVSVGKAGLSWSGQSEIGRMAKWPTWTPTKDHLARRPDLIKYINGMPGGPRNPMGARALYLYQNGADTSYRIHGTDDPHLIGTKATAGCFGLLNKDVVNLYDRVSIGTKVVVLPG
jgi:lipoprotein-anchoring transpeptidase ErfK/SrfK